MNAHPTQGFGGTPQMYSAPPSMAGTMYPPAPPPLPMGSVQMDGMIMPPQMQSAVIAKGPSAPTAPVGFASTVVPGLMDTLMMPATVSLPTQEPDPPPMVNVVYVGGLYSGTTSDFVINIMQKCGKLVNFKRHTDPSSGILANFALCDFDSPSGPYYAMECLANLKFGEGEIKVSFNDKVRGLVDEWLAEQLSNLKKEHPDKSDEEVLQIFKAPEAELRQEFANLIKYEFLAISGGGGGRAPPSSSSSSAAVTTASKVDGAKGSPLKSEITRLDSAGAGGGGSNKTSAGTNDTLLYTSREYTVHFKEVARRNKFKSKQRSNDDAFKSEERAWLKEEDSLRRKLNRIGTVKRSTRERYVSEDLKGYARSTHSRDRERERELDLEDEREEAAEISSAEARCTIPLPPPVATAAPVEPAKRAVPTVFGSSVEEDEPIFNRTYRPLIKLGIHDQEMWSQVPNTEEEVFAFAIDWDVLLSDDSLVSFLEPWMKKCILEYMGDDESVAGEVMEFLTSRLNERPGPSEILSEVEQFLDEESRGFVFELWRRLIFHQLNMKAVA